MTEPTAPRNVEVVAVVTVTYDSAAELPGLVASLPAGCGEVPWRLVVVDNASTDGSAQLARELAPQAIVVETGRNAGYAAGINAGVAAAGSHTAVLVVNPDVRLEPGCVPRLLRALREPGVGIAVPRLVDARGVRIDSIRREPTLRRALADAVVGAERAGRIGSWGEVVTHEGAYTREHDVDWAEGSTQLVDAECWRRCGPWDESFFLYSEETDYHLRARDAGLAVRYVPHAGARHLEGGSAGSARLWPLLVVTRWRLFARRRGVAASRAFWLALVAREASRAAVGRPASRAALRVLLSPTQRARPAGPEWLS